MAYIRNFIVFESLANDRGVNGIQNFEHAL